MLVISVKLRTFANSNMGKAAGIGSPPHPEFSNNQYFEPVAIQNVSFWIYTFGDCAAQG